MKILMLSADKSILDSSSEAHARQAAYARACQELHIVVLCRDAVPARFYGNLFLYSAHGNKIIQRLRALTIARNILKRVDINVITAQAPDDLGFIAFLLGWLFFIPVQLQVHTDILSPWFRRAGIIGRLKYMIARFLLPRASCIRVVSRRIAESLTRELRINPSAINILPLFTDSALFMQKREELHIFPHIHDAEYKIIAVGRLMEKEKNFSMLIHAMKRVVAACPKSILCIVGDGPDRSFYTSLVATLGLGNHIFIEPWQKDIASVYSCFDVLAMPSYIEGWGRAVIEAMFCGLAIVMTDVGLAREAVQNGIHGIIVPVHDEIAFADALIALGQNAELRKQYAFAAKKSVQSIMPKSQEEYLTLWRNSFESCLLKKNRPTAQ